MKHFILILAYSIFCTIHFSACANGTESDVKNRVNSNTLVVFFSCTNNTKNIADHISTLLNTTEFRIEPSQPYSQSDLNYNNSNCRANKEQNDNNARPGITNTLTNLESYDTIYIGFPIWWNKMPKIIYTFLESYDLSGKTIIPFCTSGSSSINNAIKELRNLQPNATISDGHRFSGNESQAIIKAWLEKISPASIP